MARVCPCLGVQGARVAVPLLASLTLLGLLVWRPAAGGDRCRTRLRHDIVDRSGVLLAYSRPDPRGGAPLRLYPYGPVAGPVVGFVDTATGRGLSGLEFQYDTLLSSAAPALPLRTTLDRTLQFRAFSLLRRAHRRLGARSGSCVVMDPATGAVLAMARFPVPEGEGAGQAAASHRSGDPLTGYFHPLVLAAATPALLGRKAPPRPRWVDAGSGIRLLTPSQEGAHARWATVPILVHLGFGQPTGVDLPGEAPGCIAATAVRGVELLSKVDATPLQMVRAYAMLINGDRAVVPHLRLEGRVSAASSGPAAPSKGGRWEYLGSLEAGPGGGLVLLARYAGGGRQVVAVVALRGEFRQGRSAALRPLLSGLEGMVRFAWALPPGVEVASARLSGGGE